MQQIIAFMRHSESALFRSFANICACQLIWLHRLMMLIALLMAGFQLLLELKLEKKSIKGQYVRRQIESILVTENNQIHKLIKFLSFS